MATFGDVTGDLSDRVRVVIGGQDVIVATGYDVEQSILEQPSHFTLRLGWGNVLAGLIPLVQPNTPFQLFVGDTPRFTGAIDGYEVSGDASSGGTITIHGRDNLAPIHDAFIELETSFDNATYFGMVEAAIAAVLPGFILVGDNNANRKLTSGIGVKPIAEPSGDADVLPTGPTAKQLRTRIGERMFEFISRQLQRAGLFLWAAGDGSFVLSEPNGNQAPMYRIIRQRGQTRNAVNVISFHHRNATEMRYSEATVYGRGGGKKFGRTKVNGSFDDIEMQAFGFHRPLVLHDGSVTNAEQAEFYARRKLAETRRAGWSLVYTVAGSSVPSIGGPRAVWTPDTVVAVDDDELNIHGNFYLEKVAFRRNPHTTTELTLMRGEDLVFATGEAES